MSLYTNGKNTTPSLTLGTGRLLHLVSLYPQTVIFLGGRTCPSSKTDIEVLYVIDVAVSLDIKKRNSFRLIFLDEVHFFLFTSRRMYSRLCLKLGGCQFCGLLERKNGE